MTDTKPESFTAPCMTDGCEGLAMLPSPQEAFALHVEGLISIDRLQRVQYCPECLESTP